MSGSEKTGTGAFLVLGGISLVADIIAIADLAFSIVVQDQISGIGLRLIGVVIAFVFGLALGMLGLKGIKPDRAEDILKVFIWAYLIMACLTYAGIIVQFRTPYTFASYITYFIVLSIQLIAFSILRKVSEIKHTVAYAYAFLIMAVLHTLIWLFHLAAIGYIENWQAIGEWFFWFMWNLYAFPIINKGLKLRKSKGTFLQEND